MTANHSYSISQVGWVPLLKGCELVVKVQDTYLNVEHIFIWGGCWLVVGTSCGRHRHTGLSEVVSVSHTFAPLRLKANPTPVPLGTETVNKPR